MKFIRVLKAKLKTEDQLLKYMNKGYSLYLDYEGRGKAFIFQKDNENSGRDISVDFEVAEQFAHDHNLYKDFESEALHYVEYLMEDNSNFNKTSADNEWWKKYYNEAIIEDPDQFQEDYGDYIEKANLTPIAFLEYKDEYESELGNMEPLWLVEDKQGNRFPIVVNMGRVRKVNENKISQVIKRGPANLR